MYTQEDVRKLFKQRGEIEMELRVRQAQYYGREAETPPEILARISALQRELMTIEGLFAALSENEAFVIRHHLIEELDWPQTMTLFTQKWGMEAEKSLRSMKALQEKGLRKIARLLNTRIGSICLSEENKLFWKFHLAQCIYFSSRTIDCEGGKVIASSNRTPQ